jgi:hypothetical protein
MWVVFFWQYSVKSEQLPASHKKIVKVVMVNVEEIMVVTLECVFLCTCLVFLRVHQRKGRPARAPFSFWWRDLVSKEVSWFAWM